VEWRHARSWHHGHWAIPRVRRHALLVLHHVWHVHSGWHLWHLCRPGEALGLGVLLELTGGSAVHGGDALILVLFYIRFLLIILCSSSVDEFVNTAFVPSGIEVS